MSLVSAIQAPIDRREYVLPVPFDASLLVPDANGELALPDWLTIECVSVERSAQTSASTVRTGFGANTARAYSVDGESWGLLVEASGENLIDEQDLTAWASAGCVLHAALTPDSDAENCAVEDNSAVAVEYIQYIPAFVAGIHTLSTWIQTIAPIPTYHALLNVWDFSLSFEYLGIHHVGLDAAWLNVSDSQLCVAPTNPGILMAPRNVEPSGVGITKFWGMQLEASAYPTSFMGADNATFTRSADSLIADAATIVQSGCIDVELVYAPQYASSEASSDHVLLYIDADTYLEYVHSSQQFRLFVNGYSLLSAVVTFSRLQQLTITVTANASGRSLTVAGATNGNGTVTAEAVTPIIVPDEVFVLGDSDGASEGAVLYRLVPQQGMQL